MERRSNSEGKGQEVGTDEVAVCFPKYLHSVKMNSAVKGAQQTRDSRLF